MRASARIKPIKSPSAKPSSVAARTMNSARPRSCGSRSFIALIKSRFFKIFIAAPKKSENHLKCYLFRMRERNAFVRSFFGFVNISFGDSSSTT